MTPADIDLKVVLDRLEIVENCLYLLRALPTDSLESFTADFRNPAAAESLLRRGIETLIDTARHLLSRKFGLSSLQYRQTALLSIERGVVLDPEVGEKFVQIAGYRNRMTHDYEEITAQELFDIVSNQLGDIQKVAEELRAATSRLEGR